MPKEYRIYDRGPKFPARCVVTGSNSDPVIDLERDLVGPDYGHLYISVREFANIAYKHGFLSPRQAQDLRDELRISEEANKHVPEILETFRDDIRLAYERASTDLAFDHRDVLLVPVDDPEKVDAEPSVDAGLDDGHAPSNPVEPSDDDEPSGDLGPAGLSGGAGDDVPAKLPEFREPRRGRVS